MPNTKTIIKNEQFNHTSGKLTIKSIPGDAHFTTSRIYQNTVLIKSGSGIVQTQTDVQKEDKIIIISTINLPEGSSDYASLTIEMNDSVNAETWDYSSYESSHDEVIYETAINLI